MFQPLITFYQMYTKCERGLALNVEINDTEITVNPRRPSGGGLVIAPEPFATRELNFGMTDPPFKPNSMHFLFAGQVNPHICGAKVNLLTVTECRNFATLPMAGNLSQEDETSRR